VKNVKFVAEMSGNHGGSLTRALDLVRDAARAGATHFKVQTYKAETITLDSKSEPYLVSSSHSLWANKSLYELYQEAAMPYEWHSEIFRLSRELGMVPFSTPFDESAVDFLVDIGVEMIKIASLEIVDLPLIAKAAATGIPLVISTGTATLQEVDDAVDAARSGGCTDLTLLVCTSDYPAPPELANLSRIPFLKNRFNCKVGFSDHTLGISVALTAIALGAELVEKHIREKGDVTSVDSGFSADPDEFRQLVQASTQVIASIGSPSAWGLPGEGESRRFRPSIIATRDIEEGEELTLANVATLRPNIGLEPKFLGAVIGQKVVKSVSRGEGLSSLHLKNIEQLGIAGISAAGLDI
jgi:N-acetylneuraminate synthase